jgi:hypothetical protein
MSPPTRLLNVILPENLDRCKKIAHAEALKIKKMVPWGKKIRPGTENPPGEG